MIGPRPWEGCGKNPIHINSTRAKENITYQGNVNNPVVFKMNSGNIDDTDESGLTYMDDLIA